MVRERLIWLRVDLAATMALLFHAAAALAEHEQTGDAEHHLRFRTLAPVVKYRAAEQDVDFPGPPSSCSEETAMWRTSGLHACCVTPR